MNRVVDGCIDVRLGWVQERCGCGNGDTKVIANHSGGLVGTVRNGFVFPRQIEVDGVNVVGGKSWNAGGVLVDLDGALPIVESDGADEAASAVAISHRADGFVVLARTTTRVQALDREEAVGTSQDIGREIRGRNVAWELRVRRQKERDGRGRAIERRPIQRG